MKPFLFVLVTIVCASIGWTVYQSSLAAVAPSSLDVITETPPPVRVASAERTVVEDRVELLGSLEPQSAVELRASAAGYVVKLPYDLGDRVEAGAVVAELDDSQAREGVSRSEAALRVAEARLKAQEATAIHSRNELKRWQQLADSGVSTGQQLDVAAAAVAVADSQVELERAQVEQVKAELEQAKLQLEQMKVRTPLAGYIAERLVSVGHLATPELPLLRLVSIDTVRTVVHVPEQDYRRVHSGQAAQVKIEALPDEIFEGTVVRKAPVLDPATRTAAVEIEIPNGELALKPGMHGRVSIVFDTREALTIPLSALKTSELGHTIFVVKGEPAVAEAVDVEIGVISAERVEIRNGLEERAVVITRGPQGDLDGARVQPIVQRTDEEKLLADEPKSSEVRPGAG